MKINSYGLKMSPRGPPPDYFVCKKESQWGWEGREKAWQKAETKWIKTWSFRWRSRKSRQSAAGERMVRVIVRERENCTSYHPVSGISDINSTRVGNFARLKEEMRWNRRAGAVVAQWMTRQRVDREVRSSNPKEKCDKANVPAKEWRVLCEYTCRWSLNDDKMLCEV